MTEFPETRITLLAGLQDPSDQIAWRDFIAMYRPVFYRMARRRGLQDADAQDAAQEILVRISKAIERYQPRPGIRFRHWLRRIARNVILSSLAKSNLLVGLQNFEIERVLADEKFDETNESELALEFERELFLRASVVVRVDINLETWQGFELTVIQGKSCEEAAAILSKSIGTIYAARSRVMKRLREQIELFRQFERET